MIRRTEFLVKLNNMMKAVIIKNEAVNKQIYELRYEEYNQIFTLILIILKSFECKKEQ